MNILILSWRDPRNPKAGGAEKLNMHILKPLVDRGDEVVWYAMVAKGLPKEEVYQGIKIVRFGNFITNILAWPFFYWTGRFGKIDNIIDSIHGIGYFSSIFAPFTKKTILICEVAQNIWDEMWPFPINILGKLMERVMLIFYKRDKFWTISKSTREDLVRFGIPEKNISILPMGFDAIELKKKPLKAKVPTALFVGRLCEMKGVKDAIKAIAAVNEEAKIKWHLNIIGRGEQFYEQQLKDLVNSLEMREYMHFLGFINEKEKFEEMAKAWVLLVPSSREGWGMIVPEANFVGTIALGYNVPGLKDVLTKYSPQNIKVGRNYEEISEKLKKINKPYYLTAKINAGWGDLYKFILNQYIYSI